MNSRFLFKSLIIIAVLSVVLTAGLLVFDFFKAQQKFPQHTFIGNVDVSGLTAEEAVFRLNESELSLLFPGTFTFIGANELYSFSPRDLGIFVLASDSVANAFSVYQNSNYFKSLPGRLSGQYRSLPARFSFVPEKAEEIIQEMAGQLDAPAVDAKIDLDEKTGAYHISSDKQGRRLRVRQTLDNLRRALEEGKNAAALDIEYTAEPRVTEKMLRENPPVNQLSVYTTYYGSHDSPNRIHNIKLIASWLNNTLLLPDEEMSLAERIGDFTPDRGFKEAFVILNGELVPQLGGGTCQIGTTLYNAVALADLKVLLRRNHSFYFIIYPLGRDATVYPGSADFKFKNDTGNPVLIKAVATNKLLSFRLYGTPTGKKVEFSPPAIFMLYYDGAFRPATLRQVIAADRPFRTVVERKVYDLDGKEIKSETIRSYYKLYGEKTNVPIRRREPR